MHLAQPDKADIAEGRRPATLLARWVALAAALTLAGAAVAAPTNAKRAEPRKPTAHPMRGVIVNHSRARCEPSCAQWISAQGEITNDTPAQFARVFKTLGPKRLPIFISSPGGSV